jgi:hypothetical protein
VRDYKLLREKDEFEHCYVEVKEENSEKNEGKLEMA